MSRYLRNFLLRKELGLIEHGSLVADSGLNVSSDSNAESQAVRIAKKHGDSLIFGKNYETQKPENHETSLQIVENIKDLKTGNNFTTSTDLTLQISRLTDQIEFLTTELEGAFTQINFLNRENARLEQLSKKFEESKVVFENQRNFFLGKIATLEHEISSLKETETEKNREINFLKTKISELNVPESVISKCLGPGFFQNNNTETRIEVLRLQLQQVTQENILLKRALNNKK